jgi:hypothetical protein
MYDGATDTSVSEVEIIYVRTQFKSMGNAVDIEDIRPSITQPSCNTVVFLYKKNNIFKLLYKHCIDSNCRFAPFIADAIRDPIREKIENCQALSIMYDGATDTSVSEAEIIYVREAQ